MKSFYQWLGERSEGPGSGAVPSPENPLDPKQTLALRISAYNSDERPPTPERKAKKKSKKKGNSE